MRFNDRMTSCICHVDGLPRSAEQGKTDLHVERLLCALGPRFWVGFCRYDSSVAKSLQNSAIWPRPVAAPASSLKSAKN